MPESATTPSTPKQVTRKAASHHSYPFWAPRFWHGMPVTVWMKLLAGNGFRVDLLRLPTALAITGFSFFNSTMRLMQHVLHGRRIASTELVDAPVFIVGHWRSGTTYLHELMVMDDRFAYPTTYQCFVPHHFLITQGMITRFGNFLIPKQRPMDNVASGWNCPQEEEFALCVMGVRTPYTRIAFPNHGSDMDSLDLEGLSEGELNQWIEAMRDFLKSLTYHTGKRLILKSPPHTGRIGTLAKTFPGAKFVHIVRDPFVIFPSTQKLWRNLDDIQGMQKPHNRGLDEYILGAFERMYGGFFGQRPAIADDHIVEVLYEDLVGDPIGQMERIYDHLQLGDFEPLRARLNDHFADRQAYKTNEYEMEPALRDEVRRRWSEFIERYGYDQ